jgi:hypothetical protein
LTRVRFVVAHKFRTGDARLSRRRTRAPLTVGSFATTGVALAFVFIALAAAGCGEAGVAEGATVSVYAEAPLCTEAKKELFRAGGRAGKLRVRVVCVPGVERGGRVNLAAVGANARRASEDTSSVGYISTPSPAAVAASKPILDAVGVPQLLNPSGAAAMKQLLAAIRRAGSPSNLREAVRDSLMTR